MRIILSIAAFFVCFLASAQNNIKKTTGVNYTDGPPTITVSEKTGSELAIDTVTGYIYQWHRTAGPSEAGSWLRLGQGIDRISGGAAPSYAPFRNQSWFVINADRELYQYNGTGTSWTQINAGGGGAGTVTTDATLSGDGSGGDPLKIAQQSATTSEVLTWTGTTWEPTHGNPQVYVTTTGSITADYNWVLVGTLAANITIGLPSCNAANHEKVIDVMNNSAAEFGVVIDPSSTETFQDGQATKTIYQYTAATCVCRFNSGTGKWFFTLL